jgi:phosphoribosylformimino-5-aminoimidazole carboxamide ribotide isomerase
MEPVDFRRRSTACTPEPMLLIIPSIDLREEHCVRKKDKSFEREEIFFDDPVKMARLWRVQNARVLNVAGHDDGETCRRSVLRDICRSVDIPIQLRGGLVSIEDVQSAFNSGVYRVVVETFDETSIALFSEALKQYSASRVVAGIVTGSDESDGLAPGIIGQRRALEVAERLEQTGCRRIIFSVDSADDTATEMTLKRIRDFGENLRLARVTVADCIGGFDDLMRVTTLSDARVDSAIVGRALYENRFPCQQSWCWNHKDDVDLNVVSTAKLR